MLTKVDRHAHEGWKKTTIIACVVAGLDVIVLLIGFSFQNYLALSIAGIGIVTFFGMLMISSYHAIHQPDSKGTMRKSITGSMIVTYLVVLAMSLTGTIGETNQTMEILIENFTFVIMTIIGFYFGSKGALEFLKFWKGSETNEKT